MFGRISRQNYLGMGISFWGAYKTINSISLIVTWLFRQSAVYWMSCSCLCYLRSWSILSKWSNVCVETCLQYFFIIFLVSGGSTVILPISFQMFVISVFSLSLSLSFSFDSLARDLSTLLNFSKTCSLFLYYFSVCKECFLNYCLTISH